MERRFSGLYEARHAASGLGRALWPLVGPLLSALLVLPVVALLVGLDALLDLKAPLAAEQVGRRELLQRLAVALRSVEATTRTERASTIREAYPGTESRVTPPAAPIERWTRVLRWIARD